MVTYLVDTSALWHLFRTPGALRPWGVHIAAGVFHLCEPTRTESLHSATSSSHRDEPAEELDALCLHSPVPENAWRWVDTARYKLTRQGRHRAAGAIGLLACATAVHHGHTVLHVDSDFATVAGVLKEVQQRDARV
ncbi:PIN domain-containing protein [Streptomyces sp. TG1A-8]|uniref:PIN domain-containing protein n=1 Tax=Streptomyces sp. TG1A-8 TaxID=3051385 RepID=UPI00265BAB6D|nr:PIN domain-containing protein [Streptomyces sp. TG1A-8]MDO0927848.1 PIN domain-containing protein [Streptomyces sp. TG1A-8]